jgi:hypothetical protein
MANGPARNSRAGLVWGNALAIIDIFLTVDYNELNRSDLRWDNYDVLYNYSQFPNDQNQWLTSLNSNNNYDNKIIAYAGTITSSGINAYSLANQIMNSWGMQSDGIVPTTSAHFGGHIIRSTRIFENYNHEEIVVGKNDNYLFGFIKQDLLLNQLPIIQITSPTDGQVFNEPNIIVEGIADDPGKSIISVEVKHNEVEWVQANLSGNTWSLPVILTQGTNTLVARTTDNYNVTTFSEPISISLNAAPIIQITSPNGGEIWQVGSQQNITWAITIPTAIPVKNNGKKDVINADGNEIDIIEVTDETPDNSFNLSGIETVTNVKIEYTTNNGGNWIEIINSASASTGGYFWEIPSTPSTNCKVRVTDISNNSVSDESDKVITNYNHKIKLT